MSDKAYIISKTLENKIAIAENNDQNILLVTLDVLKEMLALLEEQEPIYDSYGKLRCETCRTLINSNDKFYSGCGRKIKWK